MKWNRTENGNWEAVAEGGVYIHAAKNYPLNNFRMKATFDGDEVLTFDVNLERGAAHLLEMVEYRRRAARIRKENGECE